MKNNGINEIIEAIFSGNKAFMADAIKQASNNFENYRDKIISGLSYTDKRAYRLTFSSILDELYILKNHEENKISENWFTHFIKFHDDRIASFHKDSEQAISEIVELYGEKYISDVFDTDERTIQELMSDSAKSYSEALSENEKNSECNKQKELEQTISKQVEALEKSLIELTKDSDADRKIFNIETEKATYSIEMKVDRKNGEASFEEMIKSLFGIEL